MAALNLEALLAEMVKETGDSSTKLEEALSIVKTNATDPDKNNVVNGLISEDKIAELSAKISNLITSLKGAKFAFDTHVTKPLEVVVSIFKTFDIKPEQRAAAEIIAVGILQDLYKKYAPKYPAWLMLFKGFIESVIFNSIAPKLIDMLFDVLYGQDDKPEA
jgi:hypothetical protein